MIKSAYLIGVRCALQDAGISLSGMKKVALKLRGFHGTNKPFKELLARGGEAGPITDYVGKGIKDAPGVYAAPQSAFGKRMAQNYAHDAIARRGGVVTQDLTKGYRATVPVDTNKWDALAFDPGHERRVLKEYIKETGARPSNKMLAELQESSIYEMAAEGDHLKDLLRRGVLQGSAAQQARKDLGNIYEYLNRNVVQWKTRNPEMAVVPEKWTRVAPKSALPAAMAAIKNRNPF